MARRGHWSASVGVFWLMAPLVAEARLPILVLDPESAFHTAEELQAIGEQMRNFAAARPDIRPTAVSDRQSLEQLAGCLTSSPGCLQTLGRVARAQRVLFTQIQKIPGRELLILRLIDVRTGRALKELRQRTGAGRESILDSFRQALTEMFGVVLPCRIEVTASVPGADVSIDGQPAGKAPTTIQARLVAGRHKILVSHPDHRPAEQIVVVRQGQTNQQIQVSLSPKTPSEAAAPAVAAAPAEGPTSAANLAADATMPMEENPTERGPTPGACPVACPDPPEQPNFLKGSAVNPEMPFHKRWWFWTSIGAAVVVAVITGTVVGLSGAEEGPPADRARVTVEF